MRLIRVGIVSLQDHDPDGTERDRVKRAGFVFCRTEGNDAHHRPRVSGKPEMGGSDDKSTLGSPVGTILMFATDPTTRGAPSWAFGPVPGRRLPPAEAEEREVAFEGTQVRGFLGGSQIGRTSQGFRPVRGEKDGDWENDEALAAYEARAPEVCGEIPGDYPGLLAAGTERARQEDLFVPAGLGPLVAPWAGGPGTMARFVQDLLAPGLLDPARRARLHSAWRIAIGIEGENAIALQLGAPRQSGVSVGFGLVSSELQGAGGGAPPPPVEDPIEPADFEGTRVRGAGSTEVDEGAAIPGDLGADLGGTRTRQPQPALGAGIGLGYLSEHRGGPISVGKVGDKHHSGVSGDGEPTGPAHITTLALHIQPGGEDGPKEFQSDPYTKPGPAPLRVRVHHRFDTETDQWRWEAEGFLAVIEPPEVQPPPKPPEDDPPPPPPLPPDPPPQPPDGAIGVIPPNFELITPPGTPPPSTGGVISDALLGEGGDGSGSGEGAGGTDVSDDGQTLDPLKPLSGGGFDQRITFQPDIFGGDGVGAVESDGSQPLDRDEDGLDEAPDNPEDWKRLLKEGLVDARGSTGEQVVGDGKKRRYPTAIDLVRFAAGMMFRTTAYAVGQEQPSGSGQPVSEAMLKKLRSAANVAQMMAFGKGDGTWAGMQPEQRTPESGEPATGSGLVVLVPADVEQRDVADNTAAAKTQLAAQWGFPVGLSSAAFGKVDQGKIVSGVKLEADTLNGMTFILVDANGVENTSVRLRIGEGGWAFDGPVRINDKLTTLDFIDPTGLGFIEQASRPAGATANGNGIWSRNTNPAELLWYDGTTDVLLATGGAAAGGGSLAGLPIAGLVVSRTGTNELTVSPGSCRDADNDSDITLPSALTVDVTLGHNSTGGLSQAGGLDEKGLDNLAAGAITCTPVGGGNGVTFSADASTHFGLNTLTGTLSTTGTAVTGVGTKFLTQVATGDMIGSTTTFGWAQVTVITSDTAMTLIAALPGGNAAGIAATALHRPTFEGNNDGNVVRPDSLTADGLTLDITSDAPGYGFGAGAPCTLGGLLDGIYPLNVWVVDDGSPSVVLSYQRATLLSETGGTTRWADERIVGRGFHEDPAFLFAHVQGDGITRRVYFDAGASLRIVNNQSNTGYVNATAIIGVTPPFVRYLIVNARQENLGNLFLRRVGATGDPSPKILPGSGVNTDIQITLGLRRFQFRNDNATSSAFIDMHGFVDEL